MSQLYYSIEKNSQKNMGSAVVVLEGSKDVCLDILPKLEEKYNVLKFEFTSNGNSNPSCFKIYLHFDNINIENGKTLFISCVDYIESIAIEIQNMTKKQKSKAY